MSFFKEKKDRKNEEKRMKEYIREYIKVCDTICYEDIYMKEIIIQYDELIPDMFISIPVDSKTIDKVLYDIYNRRLHKVLLKFPNGLEEKCKVDGKIEKRIVDELNEITWEEPLVKLKHYKIDISLFDLIAQDVKVYILDYDLEGIDIDEDTRR
nr:MAG TPA_asm: hypothetical protein [Caudoviricetes sp.]